jgi:hypothetical protein
MKRKILIITNPGEKGDENYDLGVYVDAQNYKSYFTSPYGGYWSETEEILYFDKPAKSRIEIEIMDLGNYDFSIIIFSGHGFYSSYSDSNILELNKNERMDSIDLRLNANKRIIILDSCRKVHPEYITEDLLIKSKPFSESLSGLNRLNPEFCKEYYNKTIAKCENQLIVSYACDIKEFATGNSSKGGYYSSSLLKVSRNWVDDHIDTIDLTNTYLPASFTLLHQASIPFVEKLSNNNQNPQIEKPRFSSLDKILPFSIIA